MTKMLWQKLKYLESRKSFQDEIKKIFIILQIILKLYLCEPVGSSYFKFIQTWTVKPLGIFLAYFLSSERK